MSATPVILVFAAAVALGIVMVVLRIRNKRKTVLIGAHLLLGAGGLEQLVMFMSQTSLKPTAAALFALALICGLIAALIGGAAPRTAATVLVTHIALGVAGFVVLLASVPFP
jgi:hypothetical protein